MITSSCHIRFPFNCTFNNINAYNSHHSLPPKLRFRSVFPNFSSSNTNTILTTKLKSHGQEEECSKTESPTYSTLIQDCIDSNSFELGKSIHVQMLSNGFVPDLFLATKILMLYARSGNMSDLCIARKLFDEMPKRNLTSWNTMILAYAQTNDYIQVLDLFFQMQRLGFMPDKFTFPSVVKACVTLNDFDGVVQIHGLILKTGLTCNSVVGGSLIDGYVRFDLLDEAMAVWKGCSERDVVSCNTIIGGYVRVASWEDAWFNFNQMGYIGVPPDDFTFSIVVRVCASLRCLDRGKQVHAKLIITGFESDVFVANSLVDMYAKCGDSKSCSLVFQQLKDKNQVSWNTMIAAQVKFGYYLEALMLFIRMKMLGYTDDCFNLGSVLMACAGLVSVDAGKQLHGYFVRNFLESDIVLGNLLVDMYSKCGHMDKAHQAFERVVDKNQVSWNSLISGYVQEGNTEEALKLYHKMELTKNIQPDQYTFTILLGLCADQGNEDLGKQIHGRIVRMVGTNHIVVDTELVHMYAKCGILDSAQQVFNGMIQRNSYSWNSLIEGYEQSGQAGNALQLFQKMQLMGIKPDCFSLASALSACTNFSKSRKGKEIHGFLVRHALEKEGSLQHVLVDMYAKCGIIDYACKAYNQTSEKDVMLHNVMISAFVSCGRMNDAKWVFDQMGEKNTVSWNSIILGYTKGNLMDEAFNLFCRMQEESVELDSSTLVNLFNLCANLPALAQGEQLHGLATKKGFVNSSVVMDSTLIDMYAKGGFITQARTVFDKMVERNVISWNTMITGYAKHGLSAEVLALYDRMQKEGVRPSGVTFLSVLSACSHTGLMEEGVKIFISMLEDHTTEMKAEHYTCMVDLLARAGWLEEAKEVIEKMPINPEVSTWGALLGACKIHQNVDLGRQAADHLFELDPDNPGHYVLMSNIYAVAERWKEVEEIRSMMRTRGVKKDPGISWIQIHNQIHTFHAGGQSHPKTTEIYTTLRNLTPRMKALGYIPDNKFVLSNIEDTKGEEYLLQHSERLAIVLGLISLPEKSPIRVFKNLRICGDCHTATKFISKITSREIVIRDTNRFHHFKNGSCSCGDYW